MAVQRSSRLAGKRPEYKNRVVSFEGWVGWGSLKHQGPLTGWRKDTLIAENLNNSIWATREMISVSSVMKMKKRRRERRVMLSWLGI